MRQYRGLTKDGDWVYGWYAKRCYGVGYADTVVDVIIELNSLIPIEVIPKTVGQFTGLLDKNGKELDWWEGDILARSFDRKIEGVITFDMGCFWLRRKRSGQTFFLTKLYECVDWSVYRIGNIHKNPELLKEEQ
ncbi:MAG: YopX family protein [Candidatus Odinarchaeia archaeon]